MDIAPGLSIDADYWAGRAAAVLGHRGVGKSTTCRVLAEELYAAKVQTLIIDPMGVFWGLRADTAGNPSGIPIPVFGGRRGDVPLEPSAGKLMADLAVERGLSMVLDLSEFDSQEQEFAFTAQFLAHLYRKNSGLVHVIVDEADQFAPQVIEYKEQKPALNAMINLVRRGRNKGIGVTMASQRAASLSKNVLSQVSILAAMRMTAPADRDSIAAWVRGQGDPQSWSKIAELLPKLAVGEAWWWIPEQEVLTQAQVRRARTFDTSPTRSRRNSVTREPKALTDVDLARIADQIAATRERAAANDPHALTERIRALEAENARLQRPGAEPPPAAEPPRTVEVTVEVPVPYIPEQVTADLVALHDRAAANAREAGQITVAIEALQAAIDEIPAMPPPTPAAPAAASAAAPALPARRDEPRRPAAASDASTPTNGTRPRFPSGAHRMIETLAQMAPIRLTMAQWAAGAGLTHTGGTWSKYLVAVTREGLIDENAAGFTLSDAGWDYLGGNRPEPMTAAEIQQRYLSILPAGGRRMLQACIDASPRALTKEQLAELAGVTLSGGTFGNYLGMLRRNGLVDQAPGGGFVATAMLMRGAAHS